MKALSSITHNVTVLPELPTIVETTTVQSKTVSTTTKISSSPTTTTTTTTVLPPTSPMTRRPPTTKRPREWRKKKPSILFEHPSSHFRPNNSSGDLNDFIPMPKSNLPPKEDVQLFVVPKQQPAPARQPAATQNTTARKEAESQEQSGGQEEEEEEEEEEVTNTTIMVISVVAVIPVAGLVAWAVRTVLRRKVNKPAQLKIFMCLMTDHPI